MKEWEELWDRGEANRREKFEADEQARQADRLGLERARERITTIAAAIDGCKRAVVLRGCEQVERELLRVGSGDLTADQLEELRTLAAKLTATSMMDLYAPGPWQSIGEVGHARWKAMEEAVKIFGDAAIARRMRDAEAAAEADAAGGADGTDSDGQAPTDEADPNRLRWRGGGA